MRRFATGLILAEFAWLQRCVLEPVCNKSELTFMFLITFIVFLFYYNILIRTSGRIIDNFVFMEKGERRKKYFRRAQGCCTLF
jgi:hypothetical protein